MPNSQIILIAHNLRSCHNVGSLLRTAEGLGVTCVYLTGYTPYPAIVDDTRLPHLSAKLTRQIHKTALGAENTQAWQHRPGVSELITELREQGNFIIALEQAPSSQLLPDFQPPSKVAVVIGRETEGLEPEVLNAVDGIFEIPMFGYKESFNVVQAAAMALYHIRFTDLTSQ